MRNLIVFICLLVLSESAHSQVTIGSMGFNYSALVRDSLGRAQPQKAVQLKFTLLLGQNGTTANAPWVENQNTTTDAYGFVNVTIGNGTRIGGTASSFGNVDFTITNYWILIEVLNTSTQQYEPLTKQPLQAVPYAKVAGALAGGSAIPPGTIVAFGGDTTRIPAGWLWCNGKELDNTDPRYQALFNAIGYSWGTSNHSNLFKVPFTRGLFLRGAQLGYGYDPNASARGTIDVGGNAGDNVGSYQTDIFGVHNHGGGNHTHPFTTSVTIDSWGGNIVVGGNSTKAWSTSYSGQIVNNEGGSETRPKNVYVNYIIKL